MSKSILITGNAGLLGSKMADWLLAYHPEYEIVGIDNLFGGYLDNIDPKVAFYKRDLATDSITDIFDKHEVKHAVPSSAKSKDILGYEDKTILEEGIKTMWEWAREQPERIQFTPEKYEIEHGIYGYWGKTEGKT